MKVIGCLGKKIRMTQIVGEIGKNMGKPVPVTAIWVGENIVAKINEKDREGYSSFQIAFEDCSKKSLNKPLLGHLDKNSILPKKHLREIKGLTGDNLMVGSSLDLSMFVPGEKLKITGITKGKGFSGVIKRYHFSRGRMSHGAGYPHRQIGSLCFGRGDGQKVLKGKKMPGQMGNKQVTKMTVVEKIDLNERIIFVRGSVPGSRNGLTVLRQVVPSSYDERFCRMPTI